MRAGRQDAKMLRCLFFLCIFPHLCTAMNITCNATWDGGRTTCTISDAPQDPKAFGCEYQWTNTSDYVLANNMGASPEVERTSIKDLVTSGCSHEIIYRRSCLLEEEAYSVTCITSCRRHDLIQADKETSYHWLWLVVVPLVLLMVVVGVVINYYKRRDESLRVSSTGFMWTAVRQEPADVERANCSETSTTNMPVLQENTQN